MIVSKCNILTFRQEWESKYPTSWAWYQRMQGRPAVKKAKEDREKAMAK